MRIDYSHIEALQAAARRERSHHVYCLFIQAKQWVLSLLPGGMPGTEPCCEPA
jgi:hypothetical protein